MKTLKAGLIVIAILASSTTFADYKLDTYKNIDDCMLVDSLVTTDGNTYTGYLNLKDVTYVVVGPKKIRLEATTKTYIGLASRGYDADAKEEILEAFIECNE